MSNPVVQFDEAEYQRLHYKPCPACGKQMDRWSRKHFCSNRCRQKAYRDRFSAQVAELRAAAVAAQEYAKQQAAEDAVKQSRSRKRRVTSRGARRKGAAHV